MALCLYREFTLYVCNIPGELPTWLAALTRLRCATARTCCLTRGGAHRIRLFALRWLSCTAASIRMFDVDGNQLTGTISDTLSAMTQLECVFFAEREGAIDTPSPWRIRR